MIDERSLLAAIKDAWRTGGYSVVGNGGELVLQGSGWLAVLPRGIVPRKVLALLVEHLGEIPDAAAWKVYKKQGAQAQMVDMALEAVDMALEAVDTIRRELESEPNPQEAHRTAMTWKNWEVWQTEGLKVATFDPSLVAMGVGDAMAYGQRLVWDDEGGLLVVAPRRDDIEDALRQRLEQLPLA